MTVQEGLKIIGDYGNMMGSGGVVGQNFYGKKQLWLKNTTSGGDAGWFIGNQAYSATTTNDNDLYFQYPLLVYTYIIYKIIYTPEIPNTGILS